MQVSRQNISSLFAIESMEEPYVYQVYLSYDDAYDAHQAQSLGEYHLIKQVSADGQSIPSQGRMWWDGINAYSCRGDAENYDDAQLVPVEVV